MAKRVVFVCNGNSARSQMAEAFLRQYGGNKFEAYSGGAVAKGIHPMTVQVMQEIGIDISSQTSKPIADYYGKIEFNVAIIVCRRAEDDCPKIAGTTRVIQRWIIEDPLRVEGTDDEKLAKFREVRDQIEARVKLWLAEELEAEHVN